MKYSIFYLFLSCLSLCLSSCISAPEFPDVPEITYEGVNKTTVYQDIAANPNDTLLIFFSFTDGDGDLSMEDYTDIFLIDSRIPSFQIPKAIPIISEDGAGNGISGEIILQIPNNNSGICCIEANFPCPENPQMEQDTFSYSIQIRDRAGNFSNQIQTETITILCQ